MKESRMTNMLHTKLSYILQETAESGRYEVLEEDLNRDNKNREQRAKIKPKKKKTIYTPKGSKWNNFYRINSK